MLRFFNKRLHNRKGFTLIELIVVILILGIIAAIAVPRLLGFGEKARISADQTLAQTVAEAGAVYITETPNFTFTDADTMLGQLSTAGLIGTDVDSIAEINPKLTSTLYTGMTIGYSVTPQQLTVTLTAADATDNFVVIK